MRVRLLGFVIFLFFVLLLSRVYYLAIKSNIYYEEMAKQNAVKTQFIAPVRGLIFDIKGRLLATNDLGFSVAMKPYLHIKKQNNKLLDEEIAFFSQFFPDVNASMLRKNYAREDSYYNQEFIEVAEFIPYEKMIASYSELNLRENLQIKPTVKRRYPYGQIASHIIGYIGKANLQDLKDNDIAKLTHYIGKSGIEKYYNDILQGEKGIREVKMNAFNKEIEELYYQSANSKDITLTIDIELQQFLSEIFTDNTGVAIIMDAQNGDILAAGSFPEYDLNLFVMGISSQQWQELVANPDHPFTNKMVNGLYPPGSVVKMGVGLAFLNSGILNAYRNFVCSGSVELSNRVFRCWNRKGHGAMDLKHAIKHSCDIYFYEGALRVGIDKIAPTLLKIGFGKKTGVDLPNEFVGVVPNREWKLRRFKNLPWYSGDTLNTSIGQGNFLVTPMQIAKYTAQIASGKEITPHFLANDETNSTNSANFANTMPKSALNLASNSAPTTEQASEFFTPFEQKQLPAIKEAMLAVAKEEGGTAYRYFQYLPLNVAAKTGTAQVVGFSQTEKRNIREKDLEYYSRSHTWLTSFAPYDKPKYVVTVLLEHGGRTMTSGAIGVKIYEKMIQLGYLQRQTPKRTKKSSS